jgi:hypothetical protein
VYDEPEMREYPLKQLCCIRAGMGLGKTKALCTLINQQPPEDNMVAITYSQTLARKMSAALQAYGFVNYLDCKEKVYTAKPIVICLDSLWRLERTGRRFVFLDEALSILNHFNSNLMKNKAQVSMIFEALLMEASHIYALDACVDNAMVYACIHRIAKRRNIMPYFRHNKHIRATNMTATIYEGPLIRPEDLAKKLVEDWKAKKRSVVVSSTKAFTIALKIAIADKVIKRKRQPVVRLYNGDCDKEELARHAENVDQEWSAVDILIYSPSISAGISFEKRHFHNQYAVFLNSPHTPSVDLMAQMLQRVRIFIEGKLEIWIDSKEESTKEPLNTLEAVEELLDRDISVMNSYFDPRDLPHLEGCTPIICYGADGRQMITYDKDRLSYDILRGIILLREKSRNLLTQEYNIPCRSEKQQKEQNKKKQKKEPTKVPCNWRDYLIPECEYERIMAERKQGKQLSATDAKSLTVYQFVTRTWGVPSAKVDYEFLKQFKGIFGKEQAEIAAAYEGYYKFKRFCHAWCYTHRDIQQLYAKEVASLTDYKEDRDGNLLLWNNKKHRYFPLLLEGSCFLQKVLGGQLTQLLTADVNIAEAVFRERYLEFTRENKRFENHVSKLLFEGEHVVTNHTYGAKLLEKVFGLECIASDMSHKANKHSGSYKISASRWLQFAAKYQPRLWCDISSPGLHGQVGYLFKDDPDVS